MKYLYKYRLEIKSCILRDLWHESETILSDEELKAIVLDQLEQHPLAIEESLQLTHDPCHLEVEIVSVQKPISELGGNIVHIH
jgi:hypothetical protein